MSSVQAASSEAAAQPKKKSKRVELSPEEMAAQDATKTMLIKFIPTGDNPEEVEKLKNNTIDLPLSATTVQLEATVNALLRSSEEQDSVPFAFYLETEKDSFIELTGTLGESIREHGLGTETTLRVRYQPLALFKVRPVTRLTESLSGHTEAILHVQFSPDGSSLASGGGDAMVRFWDVSTMTPRFVCKGHKNHVLCTAWSPDGKKFASGDKNGEIRLWNPMTGEPPESGRAQLLGHKKYITSLSWEPLHRRGSKGGDCDRLVSGSKDGTARVWSVRTGRCEATLTAHTDAVESVIWGGEGLIYTASRDRKITCWFEDEKDGGFKIARVLEGHAHRINALALSNGHLCRTGPYDCEEEVVRANHARRGKPLPSRSDKNACELAIARYEKQKQLLGDSDAVPFERLVSCSDDFTLIIWYPTLHKKPVLRMTGHMQPVTHLCFSPDGRFLASASFDKKVKLWDGRTGKFLHTLNGHVGKVYQVSWAPDSRLLASASSDSTIKVWEARQPDRAKQTLSGHWDEVYALDWSPNGEMLASGSKDRLVKVWRS